MAAAPKTPSRGTRPLDQYAKAKDTEGDESPRKRRTTETPGTSSGGGPPGQDALLESLGRMLDAKLKPHTDTISAKFKIPAPPQMGCGEGPP